jgi:hypothetical protein
MCCDCKKYDVCKYGDLIRKGLDSVTEPMYPVPNKKEKQILRMIQTRCKYFEKQKR